MWQKKLTLHWTKGFVCFRIWQLLTASLTINEEFPNHQFCKQNNISFSDIIITMFVRFVLFGMLGMNANAWNIRDCVLETPWSDMTTIWCAAIWSVKWLFFFCLWNGEEEEDEEWEGVWRYPVQGWKVRFEHCAHVHELKRFHLLLTASWRPAAAQTAASLFKALPASVVPSWGASLRVREPPPLWGSTEAVDSRTSGRSCNSFYSDALDPHPGMFKM